MTTPAPRPIAILACGHYVGREGDHVLGGDTQCTFPGHRVSNGFPRVTILDFAIIDQGRIEQARRLRTNEEKLRPKSYELTGLLERQRHIVLTEEQKLADLFQPIDDGHELTRLGDGK